MADGNIGRNPNEAQVFFCYFKYFQYLCKRLFNILYLAYHETNPFYH